MQNEKSHCLYLVWLSYILQKFKSLTNLPLFCVRLYMKVAFINWSCFVIKIIQRSHQVFAFIHGSTWLVLTTKLEWYEFIQECNYVPCHNIIRLHSITLCRMTYVLYWVLFLIIWCIEVLLLLVTSKFCGIFISVAFYRALLLLCHVRSRPFGCFLTLNWNGLHYGCNKQTGFGPCAGLLICVWTLNWSIASCEFGNVTLTC